MPVQNIAFQKAARQQALADALTQQSLQPRGQYAPQAITPAMGFGEGLTQLGQAWFAKRANKKAEAMQGEAEAGEMQRREALARALTPNVGESAGVIEDVQGGPATPMESQIMPQDNPRQKLVMGLLRGLPPEQADAFLASQVGQMFAPPESFTLGQGEVRYDKGRKIAENAPKPELTYEQRLALAKAGGTQVNVPVSLDKGLYGGLAENMAKQYSDQYSQAQNAPNLLERAQRVKAALGPESKAITGSGAEWLLEGAKLAAQFGFNTGDAAADTEGLSRDLAASTLDQIKSSGLGAGSGFSNADRDFLEKVVGGKITLERKTLQRLADLNERAALKTIEKWNATASRLKPEFLQQLGMSPIQMPQGSPAPGKGPRLSKKPDGSYDWNP